MENKYTVKKCDSRSPVIVTVPGSKSITNRALLLAALSAEECVLEGALFSEDSRVFIGCLRALGFLVETDEKACRVKVYGRGGDIPDRAARVYVGSAGTAARFLTVMLAFAGGDYTLTSSEQMKKRPMKQLLAALRALGVQIQCLEGEDCFPFRLRSQGHLGGETEIDTDVSSQFASAMLLSSVLSDGDFHIKTTGSRAAGAYIQITLRVMEQFGLSYSREADGYRVRANRSFALPVYRVEPDVSAACYFYAAGAILNREVLVRGVSESSVQGDKKFLGVLKAMGCSCEEKEGQLYVSGTERLGGVSVDMKDFSDQVLTLCAIAPFASSPVTITGVAHIRKQECDRLHAASVNLQRLGIRCEEREDGIMIEPGRVRPAEIETFSDHRVAMSFALTGLKEGGVVIQNPSCCGKTFENFFDVFETLYR